MLISIDPGKNGAAVLVNKDHVRGVYLFEGIKEGINIMSWWSRLQSWIKIYGVKVAVIERITAIPGQNVRTSAEQFYTLGQTKAALFLQELVVEETYPQTWMAFGRKLLDGDPNLTGKQIAQGLAKKYYSTCAKRFTPRTKIHDGVADALGLALYAQADHFGQFIEDKDILHG